MSLMNWSQRKIKILFSIGNFIIGGAERQVINQVNSLNKEIFDIYVATLLPPPKNSLAEDINLSSEKIFHFCFKSFYDWRSWIKLIRFFKKEQFDIIYTHLFFANLTARVSAILTRTPVIISTEHNIYQDKKYFYVLADKLLSHFTDKIIAVSQSVKNFIIKQESINPGKIEVIYNSVDLSAVNIDRRLKKDSLGLPQDSMVITAVGRIVKQKGFIYLIKAAKIILKQFLRSRFLIVGPVQEKDTYAELLAEIGTEYKDKIILLGPRKDIKEILAVSDIFVMPSLWEGFGISALEAMAAGLPVVASNIDGLKEFIKNNENGILVSKGDTEALMKAISGLAANSDLRIRLASNARRTAQQFSINENIRQLETLFLNLFDEKLV
jgi:glycosyltransferase involved in cell wall biosynthesis